MSDTSRTHRIIPFLVAASMLTFSVSCATEPQPRVARLQLAVSQTTSMHRDTVRIVATNYETFSVLIDPGSQELQQRVGNRWQRVVGIEGESNPMVDRNFGVAPGTSREWPVVLSSEVGSGEYRIAVDVYTESLETTPGTVTTEAFSVSR